VIKENTRRDRETERERERSRCDVRSINRAREREFVIFLLLWGFPPVITVREEKTVLKP